MPRMYTQTEVDALIANCIERCVKACGEIYKRPLAKVATGEYLLGWQAAAMFCATIIRALTSSPVAGGQTKSAAGQQTQLSTEDENLSDVDVKVAPVAAHQADKAAAFEWLRALALGTTPDARPAALLLQEISELNGKVQAAGIILRAYWKNADKESAVTQKSDEKHQSELAEIRSRSGSYAPAVLASAADPYKECLIHHVYRCSTCHTQVPEFTFSKPGEHAVTNAAAADPTLPGLELAAKICEEWPYEEIPDELIKANAPECDQCAWLIRAEIARRQQAKEAGK